MKKAVLAIMAVAALSGCGGKGADKSAPVFHSTFTDSRDGQTYRTVKIVEQAWMAENLNYQTESSKCYENSPDSCAKYGRLYNWNDALTACPAGWHLPSDDEWAQLADAVGGEKTAGKKLKSANDWNSNSTDGYGFSALPGGFCNSSGSFYNVGNYGYWWSAMENDASYAWGQRISYDIEFVLRYFGEKSSLFSVRCVRD